MSWYTKNQAVVRSSTLGLLVLTGAVTINFPDTQTDIVRRHAEPVQATKVSLVSLRARLQDPAVALIAGGAYFDLDDPAN